MSIRPPVAGAGGAYQPVDSDLTAIAALTTTSYGRALLALADAAALRTAAGLGTAATSASTDFQPIDSDLTAIAALTTTAYGRAFLALADAAAGRTALGLATVAATGAYSDLTGRPVTSWTIQSKTAAYTAADGDLVVADATAGAFTVTLPASTAGRKVAVRKVDSGTNAITVATTSGTIDGAATRTLAAQWQTQVYVADGTNWQRLDVPGVSAIAATGTPSSSNFLRGDGSWSTPAGGSVAVLAGGSGRVFVSTIYTPILAANGNSTSAAATNGDMNAYPFYVGAACTLDRIGAEVTTAIAASSVRVGLYSDNGSGYPGSLLVEFTSGTQIDSTTTGVKELTISQALSANTLYWLAYVAQGGAPSIRAFNSVLWGIVGESSAGFAANPGSVNYRPGWIQTGLTTGAMPGTFTTTKTPTGTMPHIFYARAV